jgi:hypothetical protein
MIGSGTFSGSPSSWQALSQVICCQLASSSSSARSLVSSTSGCRSGYLVPSSSPPDAAQPASTVSLSASLSMYPAGHDLSGEAVEIDHATGADGGSLDTAAVHRRQQHVGRPGARG